MDWLPLLRVDCNVILESRAEILSGVKNNLVSVLLLSGSVDEISLSLDAGLVLLDVLLQVLIEGLKFLDYEGVSLPSVIEILDCGVLYKIVDY